MNATVTVRTIGELVGHIREIRRHPDQELWYRGHSSSAYSVAPSIWRGYTHHDERNLSNRFRARAAIRYANSPRYESYAGWLSLMQHYGLPTRLLDWSRSPLIAAYFAIERYLGGTADARDAKIWILDPFALNAAEGQEPITPSVEATMCSERLRPAFSDYKTTEKNDVIAVMAAETDLRMFVQQGCFTIHSRTSPLEDTEGHGRYLSAFTVPASAVMDFADQVRTCGFRRADIYPDLANLARDLLTAHPKGWASAKGSSGSATS